MAERAQIDAVVEELVDRADVPSRRLRADLRRELLAHFEDAALAHGSFERALAAFGNVDDTASALHDVYRASRRRAHVVRLAVGLLVSMGAALGITVMASRPGSFGSMAALACLVALVFVVWRELVSKRRRRPTLAVSMVRWVTAFVILGAYEYVVHHHAGIPFGVLRAAAAGGRLVSVAASTAIAMAGADRVHRSLYQSREA